MRIENKTKHTVIAKNAFYARTFGQKMFGLILYKKPEAMIFKTRFGVHTFFMKYPIDVIVLDKMKRVVSIRKNLQPDRIFVWNPIYSIIVELEVGSIEKSNTVAGDFWEFNS